MGQQGGDPGKCFFLQALFGMGEMLRVMLRKNASEKCFEPILEMIVHKNIEEHVPMAERIAEKKD